MSQAISHSTATQNLSSVKNVVTPENDDQEIVKDKKKSLFMQLVEAILPAKENIEKINQEVAVISDVEHEVDSDEGNQVNDLEVSYTEDGIVSEGIYKPLQSERKNNKKNNIENIDDNSFKYPASSVNNLAPKPITESTFKDVFVQEKTYEGNVDVKKADVKKADEGEIVIDDKNDTFSQNTGNISENFVNQKTAHIKNDGSTNTNLITIEDLHSKTDDDDNSEILNQLYISQENETEEKISEDQKTVAEIRDDSKDISTKFTVTQSSLVSEDKVISDNDEGFKQDVLQTENSLQAQGVPIIAATIFADNIEYGEINIENSISEQNFDAEENTISVEHGDVNLLKNNMQQDDAHTDNSSLFQNNESNSEIEIKDTFEDSTLQESNNNFQNIINNNSNIVKKTSEYYSENYIDNKPVIEQIKINLTKQVVPGENNFDITLSPEHLGKVNIKFIASDDEIKNVSITVSNPDIYNMLVQDKNLSELFTSHGMKNHDASNITFNLDTNEGGNRQANDNVEAGEQVARTISDSVSEEEISQELSLYGINQTINILT